MKTKLTLKRYFNGDSRMDEEALVTLTPRAVAAAASRRMGAGWGCRVVLTPGQLHQLGGWTTELGSCFPVDGRYFDCIEMTN
jgi:hypothetical protein